MKGNFSEVEDLLRVVQWVVFPEKYCPQIAHKETGTKGVPSYGGCPLYSDNIYTDAKYDIGGQQRTLVKKS